LLVVKFSNDPLPNLRLLFVLLLPVAKYAFLSFSRHQIGEWFLITNTNFCAYISGFSIEVADEWASIY
jgi:hypothetical protein